MNPTIKARIESIRRGEAPEGYKRTKAWILPVDWEFNPLSQLAKKSKTKNREKIYTKILTNSANEGIISQTDYFDKQIANNDNIEGYYIVKKGNFVYNPRISVAAPCGPINCYHGEETGVMSPLYTVFSIDVKKIERDYVEQFFSSTFWHRYMKSVANYGVRSDRMNLSDEDFFLLPIPMPMRTEQEKIAEILAGQDRVIALKEKLLAEKTKAEKISHATTFNRQKTAPGFSGEWKTDFLGNVCDNLDNLRKPFNRDERAIMKGIYPYYGANGIVDYIDRYIFDEMIILLAEDGGDFENYFKKPIAQKVIGKCWVNNHAHVLRAKKEYCSEFIFYLLEHKDIRKYINGTTRSKLTKEDMQGILLYYPIDKKEQSVIAEILSTADKEIELLKKDIEQEKLKKKSLMQLLLTGIVRVDELVS